MVRSRRQITFDYEPNKSARQVIDEIRAKAIQEIVTTKVEEKIEKLGPDASDEEIIKELGPEIEEDLKIPIGEDWLGENLEKSKEEAKQITDDNPPLPSGKPETKPTSMPGIGPYDPGYTGPLPIITNEGGDQLLPDGTVVPKENQSSQFDDVLETYGEPTVDNITKIIEAVRGSSKVTPGIGDIPGFPVGGYVPPGQNQSQGSYAGYPKVLYDPTTGNSTTVTDPQSEQAARQNGYTSTTPPPAGPPKTLYKSLFKRDPDGSLQTFTVPYLQGDDDAWKVYLNQGWFESDPGVAEAPFEPVQYNQGGTWYKINGYPGVTGDTYALEYTLDSGRKIYYIASQSELDSMFGEGGKPTGTTDMTWSNFKSDTQRYFGGAASEIIGSEDNFATRVTRVIESGGTNELPLPDFVKNNNDLLDIFFLAVAEGKSQTWLLKEMSKVQAFKDQYPGIDTLYSQTQDWEEAINSWNAYSSEIIKLNTRYGETVEVADLVKAAVDKGYNIQDIQKTYEIFEKAEQNSEFLNAFQAIIDSDPNVTFDLNSAQGIVDFYEGKAPTEIYDLYEASSILEQSTKFELGVDADAAIQMALQTPGQISVENIAQSLQSAAIQIAQFREDLDLNRYGLTEQALVNSALGIKTPGITDIQIQDAFSRIFQENQALQQQQPLVLNTDRAFSGQPRDVRSTD